MLQPHRGDDKVAIPVTFDVKSSTLQLKMSRLYISIAIMVAVIIFWVVIMFLAADNRIRLIFSVICLGIAPLICRYGIIEEYRFRKNYKMLRAHNFTYDYSLFWSIYDSSAGTPTIFHHTSGAISIFVAFDKDVIVGKGGDADFMHYDAIANAYQLLAKKDISCIHLDYMDNVGKDMRLQSLFDTAARCPNPELRDSVTDMLTYMQWYMSGAYSDYDIYCFTSKMRPDLFVDELTPVLNAIEQGNYIRHRILDRADIRDVVASVFSIPDFSVTRTCDSLFSTKGLSSYIRIIWTETDGKKEIVNKTRAQMAEERRIAENERQAQKAARRNRNNVSEVASVDIFGEGPAQPEEKPMSAADMFAQTAGTKPIQRQAGFSTQTPLIQNNPLPPNTGSSDSDNDEFDLFG